MKNIKLVLLATVLMTGYSLRSQAQTSFSLDLSYSHGYPYGVPFGYGAAGASFGQINQCMASQYMMGPANGFAYGPGYGPGFGPGMNSAAMTPAFVMPQIHLPDLPPPVPYQPQPIAAAGAPFIGGTCNSGCNIPPPCGICQNAAMGMRAGAVGGAVGNGVYFGDGVVVVDDRGIMEWEKSDTAAIVGATGMTLDGLASNIVPYAPYRYEPTVNPLFYQTGPRDFDFTPRPDAH